MRTVTFVTPSGTSFTTAAWGLGIATPDPVGAPQLQASYLEIPGRPPLDCTEALTGAPVYSHREIEFTAARHVAREDWPGLVRAVRKAVHGKRCRITFSDDPDIYYLGRVEVTETARTQGICSLTFSIPQADPWGYETVSSGTIAAGSTADAGQAGVWFVVRNDSEDFPIIQADGTKLTVPQGVTVEVYSPNGKFKNERSTAFTYEARARHL